MKFANNSMEVIVMEMVRDLPQDERPREKGMRYGVQTLANRELLALLIRCGVKGQSALKTADLLLETAGGLKGIGRMSMEEIGKVKGMSSIKALELEACLELSRRMSFEEILDRDIMEDPEAVIHYLRLRIGMAKQEEVLAVYLNAAHHVLKVKTVFIGTVNASLASPREIYKEALEISACELILVHNHPSGSLEPSMADESLTLRVKEAGEIIGIHLIDHLIVTEGGYFSFSREGFL